MKESHSGKLASEWKKLLSDSSVTCEQVDIAPAVSAFMAAKDDEELVRGERAMNLLRVLTFSLEICASSCFSDVDPFEISCCAEVGVNSGQGVEDHP